MGTKVHVDAVRRFAKTTPVFRARDVETIVGSRGYALLLLHSLSRGGEFKRVMRGWYSLEDDPVLAVFALEPAYLGLQEALSLRGLWEQETNVVIVTASKSKPGRRTVFGNRVIVHRLDPRYFFGFDYLPYGSFSVPVSDPEKTLIDLVYYNESPGTELLRELANEVDKKVLSRYLKEYPRGFAARFRSLVLDAH